MLVDPQSQPSQTTHLGPLRRAGWATDCDGLRRAHMENSEVIIAVDIGLCDEHPNLESNKAYRVWRGNCLRRHLESDRQPSSDFGLILHFPPQSFFPALQHVRTEIVFPLVALSCHPHQTLEKLFALSVLNLGHGIGCFSTRCALHDCRQSQIVESSAQATELRASKRAAIGEPAFIIPQRVVVRRCY